MTYRTILVDLTADGPVEARLDVERGLELLGLLGLIDPPREEAVAAVAECRRAGIRVKMITGDHATTARAIADQVGLGGPRVSCCTDCRCYQ